MKHFIGLLFLLSSGMACASDITVKNAWIAATAPGQQVGGAYMDISSAQGAELVGAASPAAGKVMLHSMTMKGGVMEMRPMKSLAIPSGKTVSLSPSGMHLMLMNLGKPLAEGESVPLKLDFVQGGKRVFVEVDARVVSMAHHMMEMN